MPELAGQLLVVFTIVIMFVPGRENRFCLEMTRARGVLAGLAAAMAIGLGTTALILTILGISRIVSSAAPDMFILWQGMGFVVLFWWAVARLDRTPRPLTRFANDNLPARGIRAVRHGFLLRLTDVSVIALFCVVLPLIVADLPEDMASLPVIAGLLVASGFVAPLLFVLLNTVFYRAIYRERLTARRRRKGVPAVTRAGSVRIGYGRHAA